MSLTEEDRNRMPRDAGTIVFVSVLMTILICMISIPVLVMTWGSPFHMAIGFGIVLLIFTKHPAFSWFWKELALQYRLRHAIRMSRAIQRMFNDILEHEVLYVARSLTDHEKLLLTRGDDVTFIVSPNGLFAFGQFPVGIWAASLEEISVFNPRPASAAQLQVLLRQLRTFR